MKINSNSIIHVQHVDTKDIIKSGQNHNIPVKMADIVRGCHLDRMRFCIYMAKQYKYTLLESRDIFNRNIDKWRNELNNNPDKEYFEF
jgi:hypothetical protein